MFYALKLFEKQQVLNKICYEIVGTDPLLVFLQAMFVANQSG